MAQDNRGAELVLSGVSGSLVLWLLFGGAAVLVNLHVFWFIWYIGALAAFFGVLAGVTSSYIRMKKQFISLEEKGEYLPKPPKLKLKGWITALGLIILTIAIMWVLFALIPANYWSNPYSTLLLASLWFFIVFYNIASPATKMVLIKGWQQKNQKEVWTNSGSYLRGRIFAVPKAPAPPNTSSKLFY